MQMMLRVPSSACQKLSGDSIMLYIGSHCATIGGVASIAGRASHKWFRVWAHFRTESCLCAHLPKKLRAFKDSRHRPLCRCFHFAFFVPLIFWCLWAILIFIRKYCFGPIIWATFWFRFGRHFGYRIDICCRHDYHAIENFKKILWI